MIRSKISRLLRCLSGLYVVLLAACAAPIPPPTGPGPAGEARGRWRQQAHWIPMQEADGTPRLLYAHVCRPEGDAPAPVAVINHGTGITRQIVTAPDCTAEYVQWFLRRGYVTVTPLRRGFGATGGAYSESLAVGPQGIRRCDDVNPYLQAREAARDIVATVDYATALPYARPDGAVVIGVSTGGYASIAYASLSHPKASAIINVSGGTGGRSGGGLGQVCHAGRMIEAAGRFGATARTPMLWVYSVNDSFFSPDLARSMLDAYTAAGGKADLVVVRLFGFDGHNLFLGNGGSNVWGPEVERYLAQRRAGGS